MRKLQMAILRALLLLALVVLGAFSFSNWLYGAAITFVLGIFAIFFLPRVLGSTAAFHGGRAPVRQ
jgi:hypothetical protein